MKRIYAGFLFAAGLSNANMAQASLISVGTGLVYDNVANVTWSSDANLFVTMASSMGYTNLVNAIIAAVPTVHDTPNLLDNAGPGNYNLSAGDFYQPISGYMDWFGGMAFMGYLNSINYLGHNTWMLPTTYTPTCTGYNCTNSMLGELFYTALGGTAASPIPQSTLFTNVIGGGYWSGTESAYLAWNFGTLNGYQLASTKTSITGSWAVLLGNAAAVPEPGAIGLMLSGLGLLGLVGRKARSRRGKSEPRSSLTVPG